MLIVLAAVALALVAWAIVAFNRLVRLRNQVRAGWSDIDVQLMRRHDLVPALVEAVRAYAGHEKGLFEDVAALRAQAAATTSPARRSPPSTTPCSSRSPSGPAARRMWSARTAPSCTCIPTWIPPAT